MTSRQKQSELANKLEQVLDYFREEYDMTYAEVCGVLGLIKTDLELECIRAGESAENEDEEVDSE